jgi:hypothetical protein
MFAEGLSGGSLDDYLQLKASLADAQLKATSSDALS